MSDAIAAVKLALAAARGARTRLGSVPMDAYQRREMVAGLECVVYRLEQELARRRYAVQRSRIGAA